MSDMEFESLDLTEVKKSLSSALARVAVLDQRPVPSSERARDRSAALAAIAKDLLYLAHLCDRARLQVMDEYQMTRGFTDHYN